MLQAVFGAAISTAAEGADYKHTLSVAESNQHKTFCIQLDDPNGDLMFEGCMVDTFDLTVTLEEIVGFNCGIKAYPSRDSSFDPASLKELDYKFVPRESEFKVAANVAALSGATAICLKDFTLTVNKNVEYDNCLGSLEAQDILNKGMTIQGALTLNYEDRTWRDWPLDRDWET